MNEVKLEQEKIAYKDFNQHWKEMRGYNIVSRINMYFRDRRVIKTLLDISPRTILDVGCGIGRTMSKFKALGFEVTGIDNSESSISFCQKKGFEVGKEIFNMDAASMNFDNNSFDIVFAEGLLEHFENYEPLVREMVRVSKKYILLVQPNAHSVCGKIIKFITEKFTTKNVKEVPYKMDNYIKSFEKCDCKLILQKSAALNTFVVFLFRK